MWHMDTNDFGLPSYPLAENPDGQMLLDSVSEVGTTNRRELNPLAPVPINVVYHFNSRELADFRDAWEDQARLNFGANAFTADLPLMLDHSNPADVSLFPYSQRIGFYCGLTLGTPAGGTRLGYQGVEYGQGVEGACSPNDVASEKVMRLFVDTVSEILIIHFVGGGQLPGNANYVDFIDDVTNETRRVPWNALGYYRLSAQSELVAAWATAGEGASVGVTVYANAQHYQRYTLHCMDTYGVAYDGFDRWRVSIPCEVDVAPGLVVP